MAISVKPMHKLIKHLNVEAIFKKTEDRPSVVDIYIGESDGESLLVYLYLVKG